MNYSDGPMSWHELLKTEVEVRESQQKRKSDLKHLKDLVSCCQLWRWRGPWIKETENGFWPTARKKMGALVLQPREKQMNSATTWISLKVDCTPEPPDKSPGWLTFWFSSSENQGRESCTIIPKLLIYRCEVVNLYCFKLWSRPTLWQSHEKIKKQIRNSHPGRLFLQVWTPLPSLPDFVYFSESSGSRFLYFIEFFIIISGKHRL